MTFAISQEKLEAHIPFIGALLKIEQDVDALARYDQKSGKYPTKWADLAFPECLPPWLCRPPEKW